jgi:hypothetical protein
MGLGSSWQRLEGLLRPGGVKPRVEIRMNKKRKPNVRELGGLYTETGK